MPRYLASRPALPMLTILALLMSLLAVLATPAPSAAAIEVLADLSGDQEVPGPGDEDGFGFASFFVDPAAGEVCGFLEAVDIAPATAAHIHEGAIGVAGPPVVTLVTPNADGISEGCVDGLDATLLEAIEANPTAYYVNVHTADYPDGAIRGQLGMPPVMVVAMDLLGENEVPGPGDPDGSGFSDLQVDVAGGEICGFILVENIAAATAAHIHEGAAGVQGPVVVTLPTPGAEGVAEGCVDGLDPVLLQSIIDLPSGFYVNVHTADYPDGAVRGQLSEPPVTLFAQLDGASEVPGPGDPDGAGSAQLDIVVSTGRVCVFIDVTNIGSAAAAHVHAGAAGVAGGVVVTLPTPDAAGAAHGCVEGVDPAVLEAIVADPAAHYVNVHTAEYPDGAVRGQLSFEAPPPPPCDPGELCDGELAPGTYTYTGFGTDLTFTTTTPWFFSSDEIPSFNLLENGGLYGFPFVGEIFSDPCDFESVETIGDSPADLMAWLTGRSFLETTAAVPVTYGGASGLQIDLLGVSMPAECTDPPWVFVFGLPIVGDFHFEDGSTGRIVALDVAGETILFIVEHVADGGKPSGVVQGVDEAAEFHARAQAVIDSFVWALGGGPAPSPSPGGSPVLLPDTSVASGPHSTRGMTPIALLGVVVASAAVWVVAARGRRLRASQREG